MCYPDLTGNEAHLHILTGLEQWQHDVIAMMTVMHSQIQMQRETRFHPITPKYQPRAIKNHSCIIVNVFQLYSLVFGNALN